MTNKETIERNIGLTFDFVNHLIDNPILAENLPNDWNLSKKIFQTLKEKNNWRSIPRLKGNMFE